MKILPRVTGIRLAYKNSTKSYRHIILTFEDYIPRVTGIILTYEESTKSFSHETDRTDTWKMI